MHPDQELIDNITNQGAQLIFVPDDDEGPGFGFTIGLFHSYGHPEVLVMGMPFETTQSVLSHIGNLVKENQRFEDGSTSSQLLENYDCVFRKIHRLNYDEYLGSALGFYRHYDFPVLQCFWPDQSGRFPWEAEADAYLLERQQLLYEPQ